MVLDSELKSLKIRLVLHEKLSLFCFFSFSVENAKIDFVLEFFG